MTAQGLRQLGSGELDALWHNLKCAVHPTRVDVVSLMPPLPYKQNGICWLGGAALLIVLYLGPGLDVGASNQ